MKATHEVLVEVHSIITHDKCCSICSNRLQTKSISHTKVIKIVVIANKCIIKGRKKRKR